MSEYFQRKKFRRTDIVKPEIVEETRKKFGLNKSEFAELMGIGVNHYKRCEDKGGFLSFRFYAAVDAIELSAIKKAHDVVKHLAEVKSGLKID